MTISSSTRKAGPFTGNGTATTFPFTFKVFQASDLLVVRLNTSTFVESPLVLNTDYTVALNQNQNTNPGGSIVLGSVLATGFTLTATSDIQNLQPTDLTNQGGFYPTVINDALDRATIQIQQIAERIGRAIGLPLSSTVNPQLANPEGGSLIGWDATGTSLVNYIAQTGTSLVSLAATTGAAIVGWIQSGSGTVARNVQEKLRERVSVADFGILPDGVTNWEAVGGAAWSGMLTASLTKTVVWPKGYYATGINLDSNYSGASFHFEEGAYIGGVFHLISDSAPDFRALSSISRASNVVTLVTNSAHAFTTGQRCRIFNVTPAGSTSVSFNVQDVVITVVNSTTITYPQTGPNESGGVAVGAGIAQRYISDVSVTGHFTTTDRLGTINCNNCYFERVWIKSDPAHHVAVPGESCRGAHIYWGTDNLTIGELIIDDAVNPNTDAALAVDGNGCNPSNLRIERVWIKDSYAHGVYLTGGGHRIGELQVDGFARGVYTGTLQDSAGAAQSQQVKAVWFQRCWDTEIGVMRTSQILIGTRGYETCQVLFGEIGHAYFGVPNNGIKVNTWFAKNVRRSGIFIGDPVYDSVRNHVTIGLVEVSLAPGGLSAGEYVLKCGGASGGSTVSIDTVRLLDIGANNGVYVEYTADVAIRRLELINHSERVLYMRGRTVVDHIKATNNGGSSTNAMIEIANPFAAGTYLGTVVLEANSAVSNVAFKSTNASMRWDIAKLTTKNYRSASGTVILDEVQRVGIHAFEMVGPDSTGVGIQFVGTQADVYLGPGRIEGYAQGLKKGTATFTRLSAVGLNAAGNTVPTDLVAGSVAMLGCNNVTL